MNKSAILALATAAAALANAAAALASETAGEDTPLTTTSTPETGDNTEAPKRGRGRPAGTTKPEEPAQQPAAPAPAGETPEAAEARFEKNRALIKPLVDGGQGEEVKKITSKYCKAGTVGIKNITLENQAAFEKDIEALSY